MRLDVIAGKPEELGEYLDFFKETKVLASDVTHIHKGVDSLEIAKRLLIKFPDADITLYFAAKHFNEGSIDDARTLFQKKFTEAKQNRIRKFLIISGHPRAAFDTIEALQVVNRRQLASGASVACAYNPFFDPSRLREENDRLRSKLAFPFVKSIYFQIGMDVGKLEKGIEFVRSIRPDAALFGCVPVPSEATLNRLKLMALFGVFLPNSYLLSVDSAKEMTRSLMEAFKAYRIEPVVFSPQVKDLKDALSMFR